MPTNLPPEAHDAERRYKEATTTAEKVSSLEEYISAIPKHKGTDRLRADLRKKLSRLKASAIQAKKKGSRQDSAFHIEKEGVGQVMVVGTPNTGKSSLLVNLTNAKADVFDAPFTTWTPTPGMMQFEDISIQLIDTPPLNKDYVKPEMMEMIKKCDVILLMVDIQADPMQELEDAVKLLEEYRIVPLRLKEKYKGQARMHFIPFLVLVNKCDDENYLEDFAVFSELIEDDWPSLPISATTGFQIEMLRQIVFQKLEIIRVFSRPPGKPPDMEAPFVLKQGGTVEQFAVKVHRDFDKQLKTARIWGTDVYDGQMVGRDHVLFDGDVVELCV